jgi:hypothetical protein
VTVLLAGVVLALLALAGLCVRSRVRPLKEPHTARDFYEAQQELTKSGEIARKDYFKKHGPRPEWNGEKSGETR